MQQYFVKGQASSEVTIRDKDTIKHMFQVMRLKEDDEVVLVFDDGVKHVARVVDVLDCRFKLVKALPDWVELPVQVTIACGFPKGDKLEFLAQKTTELGASQLWAFPADWSVVKWDSKKLAKKAEKLEKIALGAAEQSKRNHVSDVQLFASQKDFLARFEQFDKVLVAYEESAKKGEQTAFVASLGDVSKNDKILLIFGPEGGISPDEMAAFERLGAKTVGLGPRIMRAETAPLYALSAISYALELTHSSS
ncbi:16S rRNA (uracil(1498)-N(3))-methyltransferase [Streptococcus sciuri]|uniref:Ribosomal RNA small subunit methyltransferase E n=1 Tax=Streptococcus sciuri TaxID=2973939 RepID=A0ABT2F5V8_9STRE|nr:16S rRNA (uracil(1498)-N(3))-methyltransferase [Streptococcus sciuri]MCS4487866.1 16S rRNA (uracil(1498)-N(3))-methyltransferase [Streptococcus sciuri]